MTSRRFFVPLLLAALALACQTLLPAPAESPTPGVTPTATVTATPQTAESFTARVRIFPSLAISGDVLTFDVLFPPDGPLPLTATLHLPDAALSANPAFWTLDGAQSVRWVWAWDTAGFVGRVPVTVTLDWAPDVTGTLPSALTTTVTLAASETRPLYEQQARWVVSELPGVRLHYIAGSAAARDLTSLQQQATDAYAAIKEALQSDLNAPVDIYLLDRVYGQGGYATSDWIAITYTDRNYAPTRLDLVLRHELVHRMDSALGCDGALTLVREGLAVYLSGGHYRPEPPTFHLSTLRAAGLAIPLTKLVRNFYTHQHEIGYLEAASLVAFVEAAHGREGLRTLCSASAAEREDEDELARLTRALQALGYADVDSFERAWWAWAERDAPTPRADEALRALTALVDTMRAYQAAYDPVAYYLSGVLYDPAWGETHGITADFVRAPRDADAVALELLLVQAMRAYESGHLERAGALTAEVQAVLREGFPAAGLAADARAIAQACLDAGYTPYALMRSAPESYVVEATVWDGTPRRAILLAQPIAGAWHVVLLAWLDEA